ncbi:MAG: hypothetical protein GTO41_01975 [Burkholderiales bacterium]|nr:hypothetical protein [Burkholderiales bacterium]
MNGFEDYIRWRIRCEGRSQKSFVAGSSGELLVDFVGRFEYLRQDFQRICQTAGIRADLPHSNSSKHRDYRSYYNRATVNLLKDAFREDVDYFGFEFDSPARGPVTRLEHRRAA